MGIPEADAVVDLTLRQLARAHLLERPIEPRGDRPATTRRWLLGRGLTAAMLPAVYSIVAPTPAAAQSPPPPGAPTLTERLAESRNAGHDGDGHADRQRLRGRRWPSSGTGVTAQ